MKTKILVDFQICISVPLRKMNYNVNVRPALFACARCFVYLGQGVQEWTKQNLWKTAFKKFEVICTSNFLKAVFPNFRQEFSRFFFNHKASAISY